MKWNTPRRRAYLVTIFLVGGLLAGFALATTGNINPSGTQGSNVGVQKPGGFTGPTWTGTDQIVTLQGATDTFLGTQSALGGVNTIGGSQSAVTTCPLGAASSGACTFGFQPSSGSPSGSEVAGDYAEELVFTTTQLNTAPASGWDMEITISGGNLAAPVTATAYGNNGVCTTSAASCTATVTMNLYVDLGVPNSAPQPTIGQVTIDFNDCANALSCP